MKKFLLSIPLFTLSCGLLLPKHKYYSYAWFQVKKFEETLTLIPTTTIDNLISKTPIKPYYFGQSPYVFKSFEDYIIRTDSFYISQYEVTNEGYRRFLYDIKATDTIKYKKMWPDEQVWRSRYAYNEVLVDYYFLSPYYNHYPVVGVSYEQATEYCQWLTEDYNSIKNRKYKNAVFKLPTKAQWFVAAIGHNHNRILPWNGTSVQDENGQQLANYHHLPQTQIRRDTGYITYNSSTFPFNLDSFRYTDGGLMICDNRFPNSTSIHPVNSFSVNDYGLYNIAGNVAEYVREVGITKGGSWNNPGYYLQLDVEDYYYSSHSTSCETGFRVVMEIQNGN